MKLFVIALLFNFIISCWPKVDIIQKSLSLQLAKIVFNCINSMFGMFVKSHYQLDVNIEIFEMKFEEVSSTQVET